MESAALPPASSLSLQQRCAAIELLVVDVDGVLTAGGIVYADDGRELKTFHVRDGSGLKIWRQAGKRAALITGRSSPVVQVRATELGLEPVVQGAADKLTAYREILAHTAARPEQVAAIGDDLPDLPVLRHCGLAIAVADACADVRGAAHYVTRASGGRGAVREAIELILRCQGAWQKVVESLLASRP
jgi:3-deoxy-D-manno-octulosonate 8-phosphate phosphatase (KDO 8-P phosphatase)